MIKIFRAEQNHHHNTHKWIEIGTCFPMEEKLSWREIISFSSTVCTVWAKVEKGERRPLFPSATKKSWRLEMYELSRALSGHFFDASASV